MHKAKWPRVPAASAFAGMALALSGTAAVTARASTATPQSGAFSITPARRFVVANPPAQLLSTLVTNTTQSAMQVRILPVLLTQLPSGAFAFDLSPGGTYAAERIVQASPQAFRLARGQSRAVDLLWKGLPRRTRTANVGVIYQAVPESRGRGVRIVEQLLGVNILRRPGHYRLRGQLGGVRVWQVKPRVLGLTLTARNTGQAASGPRRLVLTIHDRTGARLIERRLSGDIVLPGATREFTVNLTHPLPAGSYTAIAHMGFGSSHDLSARAPFHLTAPNELPTAQLHVGPLTARGTIGKGARIATEVINSGTATGTLEVDLNLYRLTNGIPDRRALATRRIYTGSVRAGTTSAVNSALGHLASGAYQLTASYESADGTPQTLVADFQAQRSLDLDARLSRWSREHPLLIPGLLLALSLGILALMLVRERRLKQALASARLPRDDRPAAA